MKKAVILLCIAACISCGRNVYNIEGTYTAPDGMDVCLIDTSDNDTLAVTTVKDNRFTFSGELKEPIFAYVGHGNDRIRFILEPGTAYVDLDERTGYGTPMADAYNGFHKRFYGYDAIRNEERKALEAEGIKAAQFCKLPYPAEKDESLKAGMTAFVGELKGGKGNG